MENEINICPNVGCEQVNITPPEGYEVDIENSTFNCIKFKPVDTRWKDDANKIVEGYYITTNSNIASYSQPNGEASYNLFATEKQAKAALAMARISQIMLNDPRFGGIITDEEWCNGNIAKYIISRNNNTIMCDYIYHSYSFLAFHTTEQRSLFLRENGNLIKDYLML